MKHVGVLFSGAFSTEISFFTSGSQFIEYFLTPCSVQKRLLNLVQWLHSLCDPCLVLTIKVWREMCKFQKQNTHKTSFCIALSCPYFSSPFMNFKHWPDWILFTFIIIAINPLLLPLFRFPCGSLLVQITVLIRPPSQLFAFLMSQLSSLRERWKGMCEKKLCGKCADCVFDSGSLM